MGKSKALSIILAITMVFGLLSVQVAFANNAEGTAQTLENAAEQSSFKPLADVTVNTEQDLRDAVDAAPDGVSTTITLGSDIQLTKTLLIGSGKIITFAGDKKLTNDRSSDVLTLGFPAVINVWDGGAVTIDGITIAGIPGVATSGIGVNNSMDALTLKSGTITGHTGGGIHNYGTFTMDGGTISNNAGVGIHSYDTFTMNGGTISNNAGGVHSYGTFTMNGGAISGNAADENGGGVSLGQEHDGVQGFFPPIRFIMNGGTISNNTSQKNGGGVSMGIHYQSDDTLLPMSFTMTGGTISDNTANEDGGGVYMGQWKQLDGPMSFIMTGGTVSGNTAGSDGGGLYIPPHFYALLSIESQAQFFDNKAFASSVLAKDDDPITWALYEKNIHATTWTSPFLVGFNNYDINYTSTLFPVTFDYNYVNAPVQTIMNAAEGTLLSDVVSRIDTPTREGYAFSQWHFAASGEGENYTEDQKVTGPLTLYAQWKQLPTYTVTVKDSYASTTGSGTYTKGETVTINAGIREGYTFAGWIVTGDTVVLQDSSLATTTFVMPAKDVEITTSWAQVLAEPEDPVVEDPTTEQPGDPASEEETVKHLPSSDIPATGDNSGVMAASIVILLVLMGLSLISLQHFRQKKSPRWAHRR